MTGTVSASAAAASPLDLHEGTSTATGGCSRWPAALRLLASNGQLVKGRCRSTNLCDYCARLEAVEYSEMLALDAAESGNAPTVWMVLTTRTATVDTKAFYRGREFLMRAIKRRWPDAQYVCICEFTTGYGPRSGGHRRPHWNVLLKGVPVSDLEELEALVAARWCANVDAEPQSQFVGQVYETGGLMRYLALHFLKESQRPPKGWHGHRCTTSRGYFHQPTWKMREQAKRSLREKRAVYRALEAGHKGAEAELIAMAECVASEALSWECVVVSEKMTRDGELLPRLRPLRGGDVAVKLRAIRDRRSDCRLREQRDYAGALRALDADGAAPLRLAGCDPVPTSTAPPALFTLARVDPFG